MARCGCQSNQCSCVIQPGPGATVTGTGTPSNPYIVGTEAAGQLEVEDTPTIDHTLTGSGTDSDPYHLSSVAKVSADPGNILTTGPDGLMVDCDAVAACAPPAGDITTGCGIEGSGSPASPLQVAGLQAWPYACAESSGARVYCGADGSLLVDPPQTCLNDQVGLGPITAFSGFCGGIPPTATRTPISNQPNRLTINNPDLCRPMIMDFRASGVVTIHGDGDEGAFPPWVNQTLIGLMINGVKGAVTQQVGITSRGRLDYRIDYPPVVIPPGGSVVVGSFVEGQVDIACHVEFFQFQHPNIIAIGRTCMS